MDVQTSKSHGKYFSVVRDGAPVVHITRKYMTRRMAEAAAKCWVAFNGARIPVTVSFTYFTTVADGSTQQRQAASIDAEVSAHASNQDIINSAWRLLTRNWDKPGV